MRQRQELRLKKKAKELENERKRKELEAELPDEIVDNLMKIHSIHNDKYAPIGNAICDSWYDYYSELVKWIVKFNNGYYVSQIVKKYLLTFSAIIKCNAICV